MPAAFQLSPGVLAREFDLTLIIPAVATSGGAHVGSFVWGPVEQIKTLSLKENLIHQFGLPDNNTFKHFFTCANFLDYSKNLKIVRVTEDSARNSTVDGTGLLIKNEDDWADNYSAGLADVGEWAGRYPGVLGNHLKISLVDSKSYSAVEAVTLVSAGTGYTTVDDHGAAVVFSAPATGGTLATGTLVVVGDVVTGITITENGTGYIAPPTITIQDPVGGGTAATATASMWLYRREFFSAPGTSDYASDRSGINDEMHIIVLDADGYITGTAGTVLEKYQHVSKASDAKLDSGVSNYYVDVIRDTSKFIHWMDHYEVNWGTAAFSTTYTELDVPVTVTLTGGVDGNVVTNDELLVGWALFENPENVDISFLIGGPADKVLAEYLIQNIAEVRKDCIAVISPLMEDVVQNATNEKDDVIAYRDLMTSSSYGVLDCNWKYQFDQYNNVMRWIPLNGDIAGLMARTDETRDPWWSPGGFERGQIKNVVKLAWNPNKTERDELYQKGINPVVTFKGEGTILFGDKTMLAKPSAFDRINVRRLFIVLEKAISKAARYMLFEFNDAFTRARFVQMVESYLRDIQARRGVTGFKVVCDETNNTAQVIDTNNFVGDIYIKPNRTISFITLNFIATPTGVDFTEIIGAF